MKQLFFLLTALFVSVHALAAAADEPKQVVLKETFDKPFPLVYKTIKKTFEEKLCRIERDKYQEDEKTGLFKGNITSEFCVFISGADSSQDYLERYSFRVPLIRGGIWVSGRIQYKLRLTETEDGNTIVELRGELSGFEEHVTNQTHFWTSNGILEQQMMDTLKANIAAAGSE